MNLRWLVLGLSLTAACGGSVEVSPAQGQAGAGGNGGGSGAGGVSGTGGGSGGTAGAKPDGGVGGSGGTGVQAYCKTDDDCQVIDNCCACMAMPKGVPVPGCPVPECYASACDSLGVPSSNPHCIAGHCTLDIECDAEKVACNALPPECPAGQVPAVKNMCWTGTCVEPSACMSVTDCAACTAGGGLCVANQAWMETYHCVPKDPACSAPTCACYGAKVCINEFWSCNEGTVGTAALNCSCPNC